MGKSKPKVILLPLPLLLSATRDTRGTNRSLLVLNINALTTMRGKPRPSCGLTENADIVGAINILRAGHARFACEVSDAARSPAAGTHRSGSGMGSMPRLSAAGIPQLQVGEDVNIAIGKVYFGLRLIQKAL